MKRLVLLVFLVGFLSVIAETATAQRILGGLSVGMNLTQVDGDNFTGSIRSG